VKFNIRRLGEYIKPPYEYEAYVQRIKKNKVTVLDEKIDSRTSSEEWGIGLRIKKGNRISFVSATLSSEDMLKNIIEKGMDICNIMPEDPYVDFVKQKDKPGAESVFDMDGLNLPLKEKEEIPVELERKCKSLDKRIKAVRESSFTETVVELQYLNSYGIEFEDKGTYYTIIVGAMASDGRDSNISYEYRGVRRLKDINLDDIASEVVFKTVETMYPEEVETKSLPVIFYRESFAMLLKAFSEIFLGDSLIKGKTFLKGKEGEKVFSEKITIVDDGTLRGGFYTSPYDDEGVAKSRNVVVEKGIFRGFLHNIYTANKANSKTTGNAVRSGYSAGPVVGITNMYVEPGEEDPKKIIEDFEEVLLVIDLMGLHTADTVSGNFSLGISGILYKGGKKSKALRGVTIAGNIVEMLNKVERVGNDIKFYGNVGAPSVLVSEITVGGS